MKNFLIALLLVACADASAQEQPPDSVPYKMELPSGLRAWYRNPDG